jgi:hypothetical protein
LLSTYHYEYYYAILGGMMIGYTKEDIDTMSMAIHSVITTVDFNNDPWLYDNLYKATEFLDSLVFDEAERYLG